MVTNQFEDKFDYLNLKMKRLIPTRSIFNFLKAKPIETNAPESSAIQKPSSGQVQIKQEETKLLWDLYEPKEEEGLQQFDTSLTNQIQELDSLTKSEELTQMTKLIDKTNRALQMKFKREHTYDLKQYEERLYKEVIYDTRKANTPTEEEEFKFMNPLKRANKGGTRIRNINQLA